MINKIKRFFYKEKHYNYIGEITIPTKWKKHRNKYYLFTISQKKGNLTIGKIIEIPDANNVNKEGELY